MYGYFRLSPADRGRDGQKGGDVDVRMITGRQVVELEYGSIVVARIPQFAPLGVSEAATIVARRQVASRNPRRLLGQLARP
jgi:hypothetical protein